MPEGWGQFVEPDLRQYLKEVTGSLSSATASAEEACIQVKNIVEEIEGKELRIATDVECSHHLETVINAATADDAAAILRRLSDSETLFTAASRWVSSLQTLHTAH